MLLLAGSLVALFEWFVAHGHASEIVFGWFGLEYRISCLLDDRDGCYQVTRRADVPLVPGPVLFRFVLQHDARDRRHDHRFRSSVLLGDLHPHVTAIPLVLLSLAISANTWRGRGLIDWRIYRERPVESAITVIIFGALAFQNAWDILTFTFIYSPCSHETLPPGD